MDSVTRNEDQAIATAAAQPSRPATGAAHLELKEVSADGALMQAPIGSIVVLPSRGPAPIAFEITLDGLQSIYLSAWPDVLSWP